MKFQSINAEFLLFWWVIQWEKWDWMPGSDNRRAAIWARLWQFLGTLVFSARACLRELITHTGMHRKTRNGKRKIICENACHFAQKHLCIPPYNSS